LYKKQTKKLKFEIQAGSETVCVHSQLEKAMADNNGLGANGDGKSWKIFAPSFL